MNVKEYASVEINSKKCQPNSIFVCLKGKEFDGHSFISEAINNGATFIFTEQEDTTITVPYKVVPDTRSLLPFLYRDFYDYHPDDFTIIGITGTDGKTTTAMMTYQLLSQKRPVCYIGTLGIRYQSVFIDTGLTTPDPATLFQTLHTLKKLGITTIIIEASSEGLLSHRLDALKFDIGLFTNLSREHLNTHKTMKEYFKCKLKLFSLLKETGIIWTNLDDEYGRKIAQLYPDAYGYGMSTGRFSPVSYQLNLTSTHIQFLYQQNQFHAVIPFFGSYNVYNFIAAMSIISTISHLKDFNLMKLQPVEGRFDLIQTKERTVIVDFAHTPNALHQLLKNLKQICFGKLILVIGAAGKKDQGKRKKMGKIADCYADTILLTSEDPKNEPIYQILSDLASGIKGHDFYYYLYRKDAIKKALSIASPDDFIVITGKGRECHEILYTYRITYSDYDYVTSLLQTTLTNS